MYNIINKKTIDRQNTPKCFLADTPKEAEAIYMQFEKILNKLATKYASASGLSKDDLFYEGLKGLSVAKRDWDKNRSDSFKRFAVFIIKDTINEYVNKNRSITDVPSYIRKGYLNLKKIKDICNLYSISYMDILMDKCIPKELDIVSAVRCANSLKNLINAAERAKITLTEFITRIELTTEIDVGYDEQTHSVDEQEKLENKILIDTFKQHLTKDEVKICDGIMLDKTLEEIGKELNKSTTTIHDKINKMKLKLIEVIGEE